MDPKVVAFLVFGVIASVIGGSEAITCYFCNSTTTANCLDPFSATGVRTCNGTTCTKGFASVSGITAVSRNCNPTPVDNDQCVDLSAEGFTAKACYCRSDYCNDAGTLKPTYKIVAAVAIVIIATWVNKI